LNAHTPEQLGRYLGIVVAGLLWLLAAAFIFQKTKKPNRNAKCLWAMILPLLLMGAATIIGGANLRTDLPIVRVFGLVSFGVVIWSAALALIGLSEIRESGEKGKKYAIGGLAITLCAFGFMSMGFVKAFVAGFQSARMAAKGGTAPGLPAMPNQSVTNLEFNYVLKAPPKPWATMDAKKFSPYATSAFMRSRPEMLSFVIPENLNEDLSVTQLVEIAQSALRSSFPDSKFKPAQPRVVAGIQGLQFEAVSRKGLVEITTAQWCGTKNGFAYQLITRGVNANALVVGAESSDLERRFSLADPKRVSMGSGKAVAPFKSPGFGYTIDLSKKGWQSWENLNKSFDGAEFGARLRTKAYFGVIPLYLYQEPVQIETLAESLLSFLGMKLSDSSMQFVEQYTNRLTLRFERTVNGLPLAYRARIIAMRGCAFYELGWWQQGDERMEKEVTDAIDALRVPGGGDLAEGKEGIEQARVLLGAQVNEGQGLLYNDIGLQRGRAEDWRDALGWFRRAAEYRPKDRSVTKNMLFTFKKLRESEEALRYLREREAVTQEKWMQAEKAWFLADLGREKEALAAYEKVFSGGYVDDDQFVNYARLIADGGDLKGSLALLEGYLKGRDSVALRLAQAALLERDKRGKEAAQILARTRERFSTDIDLGLGLAEAQLSAEMFPESLKTVESLNKRGINSAYTFLLKGRGELGLRKYREARESFELGTKLEPQNRQLAAYLDHVNGLMGQGNNYSVKTEIPVVEAPESLLATGPAPEAAKSAGAYYSAYNVAVNFQKGKEQRITTRLRARITDESGVALLSVFQLPFNPLNESLYVNELVVADEQGKTISVGKEDQYYVVDGAQGNSRKLLIVTPPSLRPGVSVSLTYTTRSFGQKECDFGKWLLCRGIPTSESSVFISGDVDETQVEASAGTRKETVGGGVAYRASNQPAFRVELNQPDLVEFLPSVAIGAKGADWKKEAVEYLREIEASLKPDGKARGLALAQTVGMTNDLRKIRALARDAQTKARYVAIEFGRRGRIPNRPTQTLDQAYGDCKDSAVLLKQLLEAAGVPAKLALVNTEGHVWKKLPSLDQFNHMIVYVPSRKLFLDASVKYQDIVEQPPQNLLGLEAFILDADEEPVFAAIKPPQGPAVNTVDVTRELRINSGNEIESAETVRLRGYAAQWFRASLAPFPVKERAGQIHRILAGRGAALELKEFSAENIEDVSAPLVMKCKAVYPRGLTKSGAQAQLAIPALWETLWVQTEAAQDRVSPFRFFSPLEVSMVTTLLPSEAWTVDPPKSREVTGAFGNGSLAAESEGKKQILRGRAFVKPGEYQASEYGPYTRFIEDLAGLFHEQLQLKSALKL
jgi:hypothetical protein